MRVICKNEKIYLYLNLNLNLKNKLMLENSYNDASYTSPKKEGHFQDISTVSTYGNISTPVKTQKSTEKTDSYFTPKIKKTKRRECTTGSNDEKGSGTSVLNDPKIKKNIFLNSISDYGGASGETTRRGELISQLKGAVLLSQIEQVENFSIMGVIFEDQELVRKLNEEIIDCFISGLNKKEEMFFEFLTPSTILEIINFPLSPLSETIQLISNNIVYFEVNKNNQVEPNYGNSNYYLTACGVAVLNTVNKEKTSFIVSLKVNINPDKNSFLSSKEIKNAICVDYIKLKIN